MPNNLNNFKWKSFLNILHNFLHDMSLSKLREMAKNREVWHAAIHRVAESDMTELQNNYHLKYGILITSKIFSK